MAFSQAIARKPGLDFASGITNARWTERPVYDRICRQHAAYVETLTNLGLQVMVLNPEPDFPDAYFVEDTAVMINDTAVISRSGAAARLGESKTIVPVLKKFKPIDFIQDPGFLDGGDVMVAENHMIIGLSERTNREGAQQLRTFAKRQGFSCTIIPVLNGLHLKTGVNYIGQHTLLMFEAYSKHPAFGEYHQILVDADEAPAANTLWINDTLLTPKGFPKTKKKLQQTGMPVIEMDISEVIKMDGGLSCLSLRF